MGWLSDWLKSIIVVILLATFVDILLPNQTMQRYVKTVVSLFILLTLLQPIFSLFQKSASVDLMLSNAQSLFQNKSAPGTALPVFQALPTSSQAGSSGQTQTQGTSSGMQSLSSIQQQAEELKVQQEERSRKLMQQQIITLMKQNIEQTPAFKVGDLKLETGKDANGQMEIRSIRAQVAYQPLLTPSKVPSQTVKTFQVEPVKPVDILIEPSSGQNDSILRGGGDKGQTGSEAVSASRTNLAGPGQTMTPNTGYEQQQSQIRMLLSKAWQVPEGRIYVEVTGEKS
ncbi:stage III sporulation protein AF [Paenibacillus sp. 1_12]|uniref:stage III sporulation protein AF n=1 Tax=Paenibacillus sp. 1_12 TaxID=1566278 RepID=UPI0008DFF7E5|nr:stage III sporulation protein AF [Paenibacillus sp. 1_12]SFK93912.1 stage III sporulation protein AF [Paenibacillus sp. 1_12]